MVGETKSRLFIRISSLGIFFVITMLLGELHQAGIINFYYLTAILISLMWAILGLLCYIKSNNRKSLFSSNVIFVGKKLLFPWLIFILYNIFIFATGTGYKSILKTSFVQIMFAPCIILGALGAYYIFKNKTIRYFLYSVFLEYIIVLLYELVILGPSDFFNGILTIFSGNSIGNPFELNSDMALGLGLLVLYYFNARVKKNSTITNHAGIILLLTILGGKKIQWLALIATCLASIVCHILPEKKRNRLQYIISLLITVALFLFVFMEIKGYLSTIVYSLGINTMGRIKMWDYIAQYASFDPTYMGHGYAFSNLMLEINKVHVYQGHTYVLHSDVLKIFFDLGFWMFSFWVIYNLFYLPKSFRVKFNYRVGNLAWYLSLMLFFLYTTDNAINYFITQTIYVFILLQGIQDEQYYQCRRSN